MGCGCLLKGIGLVMLAGIAALVLLLWLLTRTPASRAENGLITCEHDGAVRQFRVSPEAARRFDAKVNRQLSPAERARALVQGGVTITEEELNSRLAPELRDRGVLNGGTGVEYVFVCLNSGEARAYVRAGRGPFSLAGDAALTFQFSSGQPTVSLTDLHAGKLPLTFFLGIALRDPARRAAVEQALTATLPPELSGVRVEEGRLVLR